MEYSKKETSTSNDVGQRNDLASKLSSAFMESLLTEQFEADALKENANLRQELENLRSELMKQKMKNYLLTKEIHDISVAHRRQEKESDIQYLQNQLMNRAKNFLGHHPGDACKLSKLNLFESLFNCFPTKDASVIKQARYLDQEFMRMLTKRFDSTLKTEISKATKAVQNKHQKKYEDWLEKFKIGLKIQNFANNLELKLWSHKLFSEFRNIVLTLATHETKVGLLKALRTLEHCLDAENA